MFLLNFEPRAPLIECIIYKGLCAFTTKTINNLISFIVFFHLTLKIDNIIKENEEK